jgi:hypothetical protein
LRLSVLLAAAFLQACVFVPRTDTVYDEECSVYSRYITLEPHQIGRFGSCMGRDCAYALVALGVVAAASVVVSGSIAVAGNVVYWLEKQGHCAAQPFKS